MARLAYTVTNHSLTFFIKGRPYSLTKDHEHYVQARAHLQTPPDVAHDADLLVDLVDARRALSRASFNRIQFDGNEILWQGKPLHGIWVDRILEFRAAGEDHTALFNALDRLVHNPTATAIERLPIFLDRVALPFMPDGRFLAFKGVQSDLRSHHQNLDGSYFTHEVGAQPRMPRDAVNPNPNETCSHGLHVGAQGYVKSYYSSGQVVLVAVDPVDVVAVPTDYHGEKMRVCGYEVIEHLDKDFSDELFGRLRDTYLTPKSDVSPTPSGSELAALACVGDTVTYAGHDSDGHAGAVRAGLYEVLEVDDVDVALDGKRLRVATAWEQVWLHDDKVTKVERDGLVLRPTEEADTGIEDEEEDEDVEEETDFDRIRVGDVIEYQDQYGADTFGLVTTATTDAVQVRDVEGDQIDIVEDDFARVVPASEVTASMLVTKGAIVLLDRHDFLQPGTYTVAGIEEENGDGDQVESDSEMWAVLVEGRRLPIRNRNIVGVTFKDEQLWPRTKVEVTGDTVTMISVDGHDLRGEAEALVVEPEPILPGDLVEVTGEELAAGWCLSGPPDRARVG
ncbi:hypothetical protein ACFQWF_00955 [Methylorubrum suomiense]